MLLEKFSSDYEGLMLSFFFWKLFENVILFKFIVVIYSCNEIILVFLVL